MTVLRGILRQPVSDKSWLNRRQDKLLIAFVYLFPALLDEFDHLFWPLLECFKAEERIRHFDLIYSKFYKMYSYNAKQGLYSKIVSDRLYDKNALVQLNFN